MRLLCDIYVHEGFFSLLLFPRHILTRLEVFISQICFDIRLSNYPPSLFSIIRLIVCQSHVSRDDTGYSYFKK